MNIDIHLHGIRFIIFVDIAKSVCLGSENQTAAIPDLNRSYIFADNSYIAIVLIKLFQIFLISH